MTITPTEFALLKELVEARSGIVLEAGKEYLAETRLRPIAERRGLKDLGSLARRLATDAALAREVVTALTTNETSFFRDGTPFRFLEQVALPALAERVRKGGPGAVIWSAASSTGQEAYSVAMIVRDRFPDLAAHVRIVGTDLNADVVERARSGKYTQLEVSRGLPAPGLVKHFVRAGTEWQLSPEVRRMVDFRVHNLLDEFHPPGPTDVVLCRNVLIYFSLKTRHQLLHRIARSMRADGSLLVGASEAGSVPCPPFRVEVAAGIQVFRLQELQR